MTMELVVKVIKIFLYFIAFGMISIFIYAWVTKPLIVSIKKLKEDYKPKDDTQNGEIKRKTE